MINSENKNMTGTKKYCPCHVFCIHDLLTFIKTDYKLKVLNVKSKRRLNMKKALITLFAMGMLYTCLGLCVNAESESNADAASAADTTVMAIEEDLSVEAYASTTTGWELVDGTWYYYVEGELVTDQLMKIGESYYYFDGSGAMCTGVIWLWDSNAEDSYATLALSDGSVLVNQTGWYQYDGEWYYFKSAGHLAYNEILTIGGTGYYFAGDGIMATNGSWWLWNEDETYTKIYATESGALAAGWYVNEWGDKYYYDPVEYYLYEEVFFADPSDGNTYYLGTDGYLETSSIFIVDNTLYSADENGVVTEEGAVVEGWYEVDGKKYYCKDGKIVKGQMLDIDDARYYFCWSGEMATDSFWVYDDENGIDYRYLAADDGKLVSGWYDEYGYGDWRYYDPEEYYMHVDELLTIDGSMYYVDENGWLVTSRTFAYGDTLCTADENGIVTVQDISADGWVEMDGDWYYYQNGTFIKNQLVKIGGVTYYFDSTGVMATGVFSVYNEETYEYDYMLALKTGQVLTEKTGWYQYDGSWYYFISKGVIACNEFQKIGGVTYYFDWDGKMSTGAFEYYDSEEGTWKYAIAKESGAVVMNQTGWYQYNGEWYYFKSAGDLAYNEMLQIGTSYYVFDWACKMQTGSCYYNGNYYIASASGALYKNAWVSYSNDWYYATDDYTLYTSGMYTINNQKYIFDSEGVMGIGYTYYNGDYYIADKNGVIASTTGWKQDGLYWYYTDSTGKCYEEQWIGNYYVGYDGCMAVGTVWIDDAYYYFDMNGVYQAKSTGFTGWKKIDGQWYYNDAEGNPYTGWLNGTYYIDDGQMRYSQYVYDDETDTYSYVRYDGVLVRNGWYEISSWYYDYWIYADAEGKLVTNEWKQIGGNWYYFNDSGEMATGLCYINDKVECFDENGCWIANGKYTGWTKVNGSWYYFNTDGTLLEDTESAVIGGTTYYFWSDGELKANYIQYTGDAVYYCDSNGIRKKLTAGWHYYLGSWYYINSDGTPAQNLQKIGGVYYYFDYDGRMDMGSVWVDEWDGYYFFNDSGAYQAVGTGWYTAGGNWYYFINGTPISSGIQMVGGKYYNFYSNGYLRTHALYESEFVFSTSGLVKNAWYYDGEYWYYADASGRYVTGEQVINGTTYWFNRAGVWVK